MADKFKRTCIVCGKEYEYCPNCARFDALPKWMTIYHDENCKNLYDIAVEYKAGTITKEEAQARIAACDISNKHNFKLGIKELIEEITPEVKVEEEPEPVAAEHSIFKNKKRK